MKKLVINRKKWLRGPDRDSMLLDDHGRMCCLGFAARQLCGAKPKDIRGHSSPASKPDVFETDLAWLIKKSRGLPIQDSTVGNHLMSINDQSEGITDAKRERRIAAIFKKKGVRVTFVN
jgi:hypothetical protein